MQNSNGLLTRGPGELTFQKGPHELDRFRANNWLGRPLRLSGSHHLRSGHVRFGPWSCQNALAEALTADDLGEVGGAVILASLTGFQTVGAADAVAGRLGRF